MKLHIFADTPALAASSTEQLIDAGMRCITKRGNLKRTGTDRELRKRDEIAKTLRHRARDFAECIAEFEVEEIGEQWAVYRVHEFDRLTEAERKAYMQKEAFAEGSQLLWLFRTKRDANLFPRRSGTQGMRSPAVRDRVGHIAFLALCGFSTAIVAFAAWLLYWHAPQWVLNAIGAAYAATLLTAWLWRPL